MTTPLLQVRNLKKYFPIQKGFFKRVVGHVRAVDDVSFSVQQGETLAVVGESGCGKTTVAKSILRAIDPTDGQIVLHDDGAKGLRAGDAKASSGQPGNGPTGNQTGEEPSNGGIDIATLKGQDLKQIRTRMQMVFQDPYASLNPRQRVRDIIGEPLLVNGIASGKDLSDRVDKLMEQVGLRPEYAIRYPHAFSGGQRQRIGVARALSIQPKLVVCDEPVSALDMSIQAQILNLLKDLQHELGLTYLFISHDLGVVQHVSERVVVMYVGKVVEIAPTARIFSQPRHPYTEALLSASPKPHPRHRGQMKIISGEVADPANPPSGCYFRTRCPYAQRICAEETPPLRPVPGTDGQQTSACHFAEELNLTGV